MPFNKDNLKNLRKFTPEGAVVGARRAIEVRMLNRQIQEDFKRNAKAFQAVLEDIPTFSSIDVMRMCIHLALQENDYEGAAKLAKELAEYEKPKLQRIENVTKDPAAEMSEEDLRKEIAALEKSAATPKRLR